MKPDIKDRDYMYRLIIGQVSLALFGYMDIDDTITVMANGASC